MVTNALQTLFPQDPPRFMARIPHGYNDTAVIRQHLAAGGFDHDPQVSTVSARSRAASPDIPAVAYCQGTPLRGEIEARGGVPLAKATEVDGKIQAHVVTVDR